MAVRPAMLARAVVAAAQGRARRAPGRLRPPVIAAAWAARAAHLAERKCLPCRPQGLPPASAAYPSSPCASRARPYSAAAPSSQPQKQCAPCAWPSALRVAGAAVRTVQARRRGRAGRGVDDGRGDVDGGGGGSALYHHGAPRGLCR